MTGSGKPAASGFTNSGGLTGGALQRMQKLAQQLYDSTPGLHEGNLLISD
jgi:hypothetical protein